MEKIRIKFVNQDVAPYEKEILNIDELTSKEKEEFLEIYLRLKKRSFYSKVIIEDMIPHCNSIEIKEKAEYFLKIKKTN